MKTKQLCVGCYNDFYNHQLTQLHGSGCWCFENATVVTRIKVGTFESPPYSPSRAKEYLSCYAPQGSAMLKPDDCRVRDTPFPVTKESDDDAIVD